MSALRAGLALGLALAAGTARAAGCMPPEEGNMPYHRAVARIKYLAETEAWSRDVTSRGGAVHYVLRIGAPVRIGTRCYWPLEARADGELWCRFFVSPDGRRVLADAARGAVSLAAWRAARRR